MPNNGGRKPSPVHRFVQIADGIAKCMFCEFQQRVNKHTRLAPATSFAEHLVLSCEGCPDKVKTEVVQAHKTSK